MLGHLGINILVVDLLGALPCYIYFWVQRLCLHPDNFMLIKLTSVEFLTYAT
jgi:hypothetical protein